LNFAGIKGKRPLKNSGASVSDADFYMVIVEDDPESRQRVEEVIGRWRRRPGLKFVDNGFAALVELTVKIPDLLVAKIAVPHLNGLGMARCIRDVPEYKQVPIVLVADDQDEELLARDMPADNLMVLSRRSLFHQLEAIVDVLAEAKLKLHNSAPR
jgi:CheY-like chemotaxis protein